ncbi:uncharacterized protein [Ptychodera flava]|uniref:uncharacterized protein isoform X2 n=1 Tax=Ptychodera flava TaxID=63121 RepID=UPI00396A6A89
MTDNMPLLSILLASASGHLVGDLWYNSYTFRPAWCKFAGKTPLDLDKLGIQPRIVTIASDLTLACLLDHAVSKLDVGNSCKTAAMVTGGAALLYTALGAPHNAYDDRHCGCVAIDLGYNAARVGVMSLVLLYMAGRFE